MSAVYSGQVPAFAGSGGWPALPALGVTWDGATAAVAYPGGAPALTVSGQAIQQAGTPQALAAAVAGGNPWEALSV